MGEPKMPTAEELKKMQEEIIPNDGNGSIDSEETYIPEEGGEE